MNPLRTGGALPPQTPRSALAPSLSREREERVCAYTRALRALVYAPLQLGSGMAIPATLRAHIPARGARGRKIQ